MKLGKKYASQKNLDNINGMIEELRRISKFSNTDKDGKALLSEAEQKLKQFHKERS